ncbi:DNA-binding MarR family transcriptional regulator [Hephaestia caeni]|uniref:DNA-binding MarR family transcriptional regulator n=1 Tax=Hephaestia caeni TaxID=645617 RepID=A0A397NP08_9SPHN|nr:MarR family transcriptional regulator [Hephaestia caeni]RIA35384.1 DNA-binding MarR family transcriptional regulator [Hephaestia caeni]
MAGDPLCDRDYEALATFRYELRRFVRFSEEAAIAAGLTPQHYQVLLTLRASPDGAMLVGALAGRLLLRPHSTTELVNRLEKLGLVERHHAPDDRRKVHVAISAQGRAAITSLAAHHRAELRRMRPMLERLLGSM